MVTAGTRAVLFGIFGFGALDEHVQQALEQSAGLLEQFCGATIAGRLVIRAEQAPDP
jgi:hypothetical protein